MAQVFKRPPSSLDRAEFVGLYGRVQWSGRGRFLFERPAWAFIDRPTPRQLAVPAE